MTVVCSFCGFDGVELVVTPGHGNCVECGGKAAICLDCAAAVSAMLDDDDGEGMLPGWTVVGQESDEDEDGDADG